MRQEGNWVTHCEDQDISAKTPGFVDVVLHSGAIDLIPIKECRKVMDITSSHITMNINTLTTTIQMAGGHDRGKCKGVGAISPIANNDSPAKCSRGSTEVSFGFLEINNSQ